MAGFKSDQVAALDPTAMAGFDATRWRLWTQPRWLALKSDQVAALDPTAMAGFDATKMAAMDPTAMAGF